MGHLDSYQQAAVDHGDGPAIVLAGPGSGKTRVIVERAVRLIDDEHARPEQLLVLTFSRKAAADLRERIAARLQRSYASFPVTTFHAFSLALLARDSFEPPRLARPVAAWKVFFLVCGSPLWLRPSAEQLGGGSTSSSICSTAAATLSLAVPKPVPSTSVLEQVQ